MKVSTLLLCVMAVLALSQACSNTEEKAIRSEVVSLTSGPGPSLVLIDSIVLEDRDSLYLAKPEQSFTVDDRGMYYIADQFVNRLIRYRPDGRIDRVFGKAGDGPGELRSTQRVTLIFDTVIMQATAGKLLAFQRQTGRYLFQRWHQRGYLTAPQYAGRRVFLPIFDRSAGYALLATTSEDLLHVDEKSPREPLVPQMIAFPPEYLKHPTLNAFSQSSLAIWQDTLLIGFSGVPYVVIYTMNGAPIDTVIIPSRMRHGHPAGWLSAFSNGRNPSLEDLVGALSFLNQLWRLPDGQVVFWHQDNSVIKTGSRPRLKGTAFISVLSRDRSRACVDTRIPFPGTDWPILAMRGDTLLALDQISDPRNMDTVRTVLRRYLIETSHCRWLSVSRTN